MRYTKKITKNYGCKMNDYMWKDNSYNHSRLGIDKLGQLEDIEGRLGNTIILIYNAMNTRQPIYSYGTFGGIRKFEGMRYLTPFNQIIAYEGKAPEEKDNFVVCRLKNHGKTWALTREELEK